MSEETLCFSADVYEDGKLIAHVKNTGHGGSNYVHPAKGLKYKDVQHLDNLDTECEIMEMAEDINITKKYQTKALVLKKGYEISTVSLSMPIAQIKKKGLVQKLMESVKKWEGKGFKVLNTNI